MSKRVAILLAFCAASALAAAPDAVVGKGEKFASIQAALDAAPSNVPAGSVWLILIRNGDYHEKLFIRKSNVALVGESRDSVRIVEAVLREEWANAHNGSDWGAGVVNIDTGTSGVILANLTVYNNHGALYGTEKKHQFAVRGFGTRIVLLDCTVKSDGGDALSLWDRHDGMYYHAHCSFEGWVDYVCPRGWCYITGSGFYGHNTPSASIWHDGSSDRDQKFVIVRSNFDGVPGFPLGRNHLDGQFYLLDCRFSKNMADRPFYRPPSSPRPWQWGDRHYYYNCHGDSADFSWFADNFAAADGSPGPLAVTARWTFGGRWDPERTTPAVLPYAAIPLPEAGDPRVQRNTICTWTPGREASEHRVYFDTAAASPRLAVTTREARFDPGPLAPGTRYYWRVDEVTAAGVVPGRLWNFTTSN